MTKNREKKTGKKIPRNREQPVKYQENREKRGTKWFKPIAKNRK